MSKRAVDPVVMIRDVAEWPDERAVGANIAQKWKGWMRLRNAELVAR
jgi:hypothetical protein